MARKIKPKVKVPRKAKKGSVIQIKTALKHPMETGWRKNKDGKTVPKNRIEKFVCKFRSLAEHEEDPVIVVIGIGEDRKGRSVHHGGPSHHESCKYPDPHLM